MKSLIAFPIFIMFLFAVFSIANVSSYYNGTMPENFTSGSGGADFGNNYYICENGTYVFLTEYTDFELTFHYAVNSTVWFTCNYTEIESIGGTYGYTLTFVNETEVELNISQEYAEWVFATTTGSTHLNFAQWILSEYDVMPPNTAFVGGFGTMTIAIVVITILMSIAAVAGLRAFGTGLAGVSVEVLTKGVFYFGFWIILSALSATAILAMPFAIGSAFYAAITLMYLFGFVSEIRGGGE